MRVSLTLGYVDGYKIRDILAPGVDPSLKDWVMLKLYNLTWQQLLCFGVVHVDPHPGNYLVTHHPKLGMLDFGCIRILPPDLRDAYRDLNRALLEDDDTLSHAPIQARRPPPEQRTQKVNAHMSRVTRTWYCR